MNKGLDGRDRDENGQIRRKNGNTLVGTLRKEYPEFAPGTRKDAKLETVLKRTERDSLSDYLKHPPKH